MDSHFQVSPEIFDWVQVRALAELLKDIHRVVLKPLLLSLGCALSIIVWLEGEPSGQCEILSALDQVFIKDISRHLLASFHFPSNLTRPPVPVAERQPHSMMLPTPCFIVGMLLGR